MKVLEYSYLHPYHQKPVVKIQSGFIFKKVRSYICTRVGFFGADWFCLDTGETISFLDRKLYTLLNNTGTKAQLEYMNIQKG